jgi:alkylation response protein AidB-like acyl-CoA dehydrogenase
MLASPPNHAVVDVPETPDFPARARALAPHIAQAARQIERERQLPSDLVAALHGAKLFRMLLPRSVGGGEVDPPTYFETIEAIGKADASTAWCIAQASGASMGAAYMAPDAARTVYGAGDAVMASGPGTTGTRAQVVDGGYRVTGNWGFASGSRHATWFGGHCLVYEANGSLRTDGGKPIDRTVLVPRSSVTTEDTWDVIGLRGTGSDSYFIRDLFVPEAFSYQRDSATDRRETGPLYRFAGYEMFATGFAAIALGIGRATLEEFIDLAGRKTPKMGTAVLRDSAVIQAQVGLSEARLLSARALMANTLQGLWEAASQGERLEPAQRARLRLAATFAIHQARDVVDACYHAAGATAVFADNPFERRFRDVHTITQQVQAHATVFEQVGQMLLGVAPATR